jgi:hypothetical protein
MTARRLHAALAAIAGGVAVAAVIAGAAFALETTLAGPSAGDRLATRVLARLARTTASRARVQILGLPPLAASCRRLGRHEVARLGRDRVLVVSTHVRALSGPAESSLARAAETDLAACPRLLTVELAALMGAGPVTAAATYWRGRPVYALRLRDERPLLVLFVSRRTLDPLGLSFASRTIDGSSVVLSLDRLR